MTSLWKADKPKIEGVPLESDARYDIIVIGAGITGLSTAYMLVRDGLRVAVLEQGDVGQLASGNNTGKLSMLHGTRLSKIRRDHSARMTRAYVESNLDGMAWILEFCEEVGVPYTRETAYTYAQEVDGMDLVRSEYAAAREAGLGVELISGIDVPFPFVGAVALHDQVAIDPDTVVRALASSFIASGGVLHTGTRVISTRVTDIPHVEATNRQTRSTVRASADQIVLATGTPLDDRGLYFAKAHGSRSYALSFALDEEPPSGMFLTADSPGRSIRRVSAADGSDGPSRLVIGGNGHPVGRADSERAQYDDLVEWTHRYFPGAVETHRWSAQDYEPHDLLPFSGTMPRSRRRMRFGTGYAKWGLTNGPAAALRIAADVRGIALRDRPDWMQAYETMLPVPADVGRAIAENARVGRYLMSGWVGAQRRAVPVPKPTEGTGVVANRGGRPVGIATVDGVTCAVSAVCSHLGGVVRWNDAEQTWDCPLHASRFTADGQRIEGPANEDLTRLEE